MTPTAPEQPTIHIWKEAANDRIAVTWDTRPGYYVNTDHPDIKARVDAQGQVIGFQADALSRLPTEPVTVIPCRPADSSQ